MAQVKTVCNIFQFPNHFVLHLQIHEAWTSKNVWVRISCTKKALHGSRNTQSKNLEFLKAYILIHRVKEGQKFYVSKGRTKRIPKWE